MRKACTRNAITLLSWRLKFRRYHDIKVNHSLSSNSRKVLKVGIWGSDFLQFDVTKQYTSLVPFCSNSLPDLWTKIESVISVLISLISNIGTLYLLYLCSQIRLKSLVIFDKSRTITFILFFQKPLDVTNHSVAREVVTFFTLPPGDFIVVPQTNVPDCDGKFLLRIFTDEQSNIWWVIVTLQAVHARTTPYLPLWSFDRSLRSKGYLRKFHLLRLRIWPNKPNNSLW